MSVFHRTTTGRPINKLMQRPSTELAEQRMLHNYVERYGWRIPENIKEQCIKQCSLILHDTRSRPRDKVAAARTLVAMDALNVKLVGYTIPKNHIHHKAKDLTDEELNSQLVEMMNALGAKNISELKEKLIEQSNEPALRVN